jgi:hypothetical protein
MPSNRVKSFLTWIDVGTSLQESAVGERQPLFSVLLEGGTCRQIVCGLRSGISSIPPACVILSMTTTALSSVSRSGQMHIAGNAFQRAVQTPSLSPLPQEVLLLPLGLGLGLFLLLLLLHTLRARRLLNHWRLAPTIYSCMYSSHDWECKLPTSPPGFTAQDWYSIGRQGAHSSGRP